MRIILYILAALGLLFVAQLLFGLYLIYGVSDEMELFENRNGLVHPQQIDEFVYISHTHDFDPFANKEKIASGNARVSGSFIFNGEPVAGVKFRLHINDKISPDLVTGADGLFSFSIPNGQHRFHLLEIESWDSGPKDGAYMVVSRYNRTLDDLLNYVWNEQEELIDIQEGENYHIGDFTISKQLSFSNPADTKIAVMENPSAQILQWNKHPFAQTYVLDIQSVKRRGSSATMTSVVKEITKKTEFNMESLTLIPNEDETSFEYALDLKAYNAQGELVSESGYPSSGFKLTGLEIADHTELDSGRKSIEDILQISKANEQIEVIKILIEENMLSSAKELLAKVKSDNTDWRLDRIKGYLAAKQAKCDEARAHFKQAELKAGFKCVADKYWAQCRG